MSRPALSFKSVGLSRRWVAAIEPAKEVIAFSPFITNCAAIDALRKKGPACKLYTVVTPKQYTSGGSKVGCLRKLFDAGVEIYHLEKLHAKILLIDENTFVTIGSQNLTSGGTRNREATVVFDGDRVTVDRIAKAVKEWRAAGQDVTELVVQKIEKAVRDLGQQHRKWQEEAEEKNREVWEAWEEEKRERERKEREERERQEREAREREAKERAATTPKPQHYPRATSSWSGWVQRVASDVVRGRVIDLTPRESGYKFSLVNEGYNWGRKLSYLKWKVGKEEIELDSKYWYACFNLDTRDWGKARVFETRISFIDCTMGWDNNVTTRGHRYDLSVNCRRVKDPDDPYNMNIIVDHKVGGEERRATILGNYDIVNLTADTFLDEAKWAARNTPEDIIRPFRELQDAINNNTNGIQEKVLAQITRWWPKNELVSRYRVDQFFDRWQYVYTGLRVLPDNQRVLVFSRHKAKVREVLLGSAA